MALEPSVGTGDAGRHQEEEDTDLFPEELMKKGNNKVYLAVLGLSCITWDLCCLLWDL